MTPTKEWLAVYESKKELLASPADLNAYFTSDEIADKSLDTMSLGEINVTTGKILVRDPLVTLGEDSEPYFTPVPTGRCPLTACVVKGSYEDCARYAAVKVDFSDRIPVQYVEALIGDEDIENFNGGEYYGFNVDAGLGTIVDTATAKAFAEFRTKWHTKHPEGNLYDDYFAAIFAENYKKNPLYQRLEGDWINWTIPGTDFNVPMFQSGFGDGAYPVYFGYDEDGNVCRLVIQFIDIEMAYSEGNE